MDNGTSFDRVKAFLNESKTMSPEVVATRVRAIEDDIYALFHSVERVHIKHPQYKDIDLGEDFYALVRMLEHSKVKKQFPLLARAAAMF